MSVPPSQRHQAADRTSGCLSDGWSLRLSSSLPLFFFSASLLFAFLFSSSFIFSPFLLLLFVLFSFLSSSSESFALFPVHFPVFPSLLSPLISALTSFPLLVSSSSLLSSHSVFILLVFQSLLSSSLSGLFSVSCVSLPTFSYYIFILLPPSLSLFPRPLPLSSLSFRLLSSPPLLTSAYFIFLLSSSVSVFVHLFCPLLSSFVFPFILLLPFVSFSFYHYIFCSFLSSALLPLFLVFSVISPSLPLFSLLCFLPLSSHGVNPPSVKVVPPLPQCGRSNALCAPR